MNKNESESIRLESVKRYPFGEFELRFAILNNNVIALGTKDNIIIAFGVDEVTTVESSLFHYTSVNGDSPKYCWLSRHADYQAAKGRLARDILSYKRLCSILWCMYGLGLDHSKSYNRDFVILSKPQTRRTPYGEHSSKLNSAGFIFLCE